MDVESKNLLNGNLVTISDIGVFCASFEPFNDCTSIDLTSAHWWCISAHHLGIYRIPGSDEVVKFQTKSPPRLHDKNWVYKHLHDELPEHLWLDNPDWCKLCMDNRSINTIIYSIAVSCQI